MGVHGLWELLAPVGRRVSVETLTGKKLAIDASIWMIQFMKAMRDEKGEMVRNAHILGFFRRICKLLFLRTKPVFVFDGGTPALKRRTVIARRRQRENAQAKIRKTAEKLLLNHVKAMRLKELAAELENQGRKNDIKGKKAIIEEPNIEHNAHKENDEVPKSWTREELDEKLAASLAVEEKEGFTVDASRSGADEEEDDDDEDEEMILPEMHGKVDPAVLAALPPSMQLDLLVQMRERLMAENRHKYQKVKKVPARFSELQIQAYLKTVAFRREIDGVQKSAAGRGIGGVQTSRIASEANREFIFSSSFTGDKQVLTSAGQESSGSGQNQKLPVNSFNRAVNEVRSIARSDALNGLTEDQTGNALDHDVNTYLDERGRLRVSRVRAMGIRMTRDLQRNLDLMKEIEQEKADTNQEKLNGTTTAKTLDDVLSNALERIQHHEVENQNNDGTKNKDNETEDTSVKIGTMEISFEDTGHNCGHDDDDIFASLVAGHPSVVDLTTDYSASLKQSLDSDSDLEWEEGVIEDKRNIVPSHFKAETKPSFMEEGTSNEVDVEWEEGFQGIQVNSSSFPDDIPQTVRKGALVEEAEFQEAIKRSLEDLIDNRTSNNSREDQELEDLIDNKTLNNSREDQEQGRSEKMVDGDNTWRSVHEAKGPQIECPAWDTIQPVKSTQLYDIAEINPKESCQNQKLVCQDMGVSGALSGEFVVASDTVLEEKDLCRSKEQIIDTCSMGGNEHVMNKPIDTCGGELVHNSDSSFMSYSFNNSNSENRHETDLVDGQHGMSHAAVDEPFCMTEKSAGISVSDSLIDADCTKQLTKENIFVGLSTEKDMPERNLSSIDVVEHEVKNVDLQEEMIFLHKEREELGIEQRKLERNSESATSEMFAECQELLQMFGLPYIIAPMEAEAQCAYMEFFNLVDGVVTDDSDAFLFGARSVYKNIFDDRKYVETYLLKDIENELGLNREKLINMALLLGSDYTEGVSGIGIVNAMEVVNAFPEKTGLHEFREWIESPDPTILGNFDGQSGKSKGKGSKDHDTLKSCSSSNADERSCDQDHKMMKQTFMDKHRNVSKNWHIPSSFPSDAVISAYTSPQVDKSNEPFSWGKPDLFALRKLCWEKFGWGSSKADELLLPVLKEYNKHETQLRLEAFYTFNERFAKIRSKRIKKAVKGIIGNKSSELMDEEMPQQSRVGKKRKAKPSEFGAEASGTRSKEPECTVTANQISTKKQTNVVLPKGGRRKENASQLDVSNLEQSTSIDNSLSMKEKSSAGGRQKTRGRQKETGGGSRKRNSHFEDTEMSYDGCREKEGGLQFDNSEESQEVRRRSGRLHKVVNYCIPDEFDDCDKESEVDKYTTTKDSLMGPCVDWKDTYVDGLEDPGIGGELSVDETEQKNMTDKRGITQDDEYSGKDESTRGYGYIQFGGGFCSDEEDDNIEFGGHAASASRETISENFNMITGFDSEEEKRPETGSLNLNSNRTENLSRTDVTDTQIMNDNVDDDSNLSSTMLTDSLQDAGNDHESRSTRFLRAMPNLRRKKKKT
ncbi:DNA repair protein UVH3-like [Primulina tabacum]|uniref:DNA repair protein UVH3-like n=1 Tax=Primulina tabacum TaxID=48773 RepID=UPI003F592F86